MGPSWCRGSGGSGRTGGPAVGLWLPEVRGAVEALPWLEGFCEVRLDHGRAAFSVRDPSPLGLRSLGGAGSFELGPESLDAYREFGFPGFDRPPVTALGLLAHRSGPDDHRAFGHLALWLAERFDALIDFTDELPRQAVELPGRLREQPYGLDGGGRALVHVGDREFLAAWLRHPEFRLVT
ncbi:DUF6368 family protein [Kitasatospora sp. NPDC048722]|uniref:DUF6368 family protein n=1 Tax=Kitasatospora sp. NPDC048722 TaxID=3155639 RepID=UPI0033CBDEE1